ncbi:reverse transcriptase domain-containing protein [Tanacetum coccineum]
MDALTMKMDAQYKEIQSYSKSNPDHNDVDIPMSREEEAKCMQTFRRTHFYNDYHNRDSNRADLGASINLMPYSLYAKLTLETLNPIKMSVRLADRSFQYPIGIDENMLVEVGKFTFPADFVILEMEEDKEDFDALLGEGSEILHSIEGPILEEKLIAEFDEFMAMTTDENSESESDTEKPPFEKITFNTDYKIKTSLEEPSMDLELKPLPDNLEYIFLEEPSFLPVIISSQLSEKNKNKLVSVLDVLSLYGIFKMIQVLNLYFADSTKNNTLTGSVPDR